MNFKVLDKNTYLVKINNSYKKMDEDNQIKTIKDILLLIKKRYAVNIYGYYEVNIYYVDNLLTILVFKKTNNEDIFYNTIDLKIINHNKKLDITVEDFTLDKNNIYKICEHYLVKDINLLY